MRSTSGGPAHEDDITCITVRESALSSLPFALFATRSKGQGSPRREEGNDTREVPVADPLIGMVIADRYRILEPVGRGGMGIVYKVEHIRIGKLLAMKLLTGELAHNPDVVRRFKREALIVSRLQSPSTVQVVDFGVSEGLTWLVMELVDGETLGRALHATGPIPFARLGKIVLQVCSSLAEAHQKGIVHRDIKPDNIMLLSAGGGADVAKVLDFGLAKLREAEGLAEITGQGMILGTPYYMAPEQIRGEAVDSRADIYAVGALMYRALTGHHPFSGTALLVLSKHLDEAPVPPTERAPDLGIPIEVSRIVMRALRKSPADRFQRIDDLRALLVEALRIHGASSTTGEGFVDPRGRFTRRNEAFHGDARPAIALATRDEVDAYERKLRRARYGAVAIAATVVAAASAATGLFAFRDAELRSVEVEPNNTPAEATVIALGRTVTGHLGQRIDASRGDRDFYAIDLPASGTAARPLLGLRLGALPNLATCAMIYRPGFLDAVGQYCAGRPGQTLVIPALRLDPGRYLIAVLQDVESYGGAPVFVHENISDAYTLLAERVTPEPATEIEPNDQIAAAASIGVGRPLAAAIGWRGDEDVFCADEAVTGLVRWRVRAGSPDGGVFEVTTFQGGDEGPSVRVHSDDGGNSSSADVVSSWRSDAVVTEVGNRACLRVRLTTDPWSPACATRAPSGGNEPYVVQIEPLP